MGIKRKLSNFLLKATGYEFRKKPPPTENETVVSLQPEGPSRGSVLIAYFTEPFVVPPDAPLFKSHAHFEESRIFVETFLELGYSVDVIDYRNTKFKPIKPYAFLVSARTNLELYANRLNGDCTKIAHLEMAHWLFNNPAAYQRCVDLLKRRKIALGSISKLAEFNWAIENADYAVVLGNKFTMSTYAYANTPIFSLNNFSVVEYDSPEKKNFVEVRNTFIWLGSDGMIHKGLDLVLEAFSGLPDHRLIVCGPVRKDHKFEKAYEKELYHTPNISTNGWVDITGPDFKRIIDSTLAVIYPSASEGQAGSVVTCIHAGLIPVISYQTGVDVNDFGIILNECSIDQIKSDVLELSSKPAGVLKEMAMKSWRVARESYSRDHYKKSYKEIIGKIMDGAA